VATGAGLVERAQLVSTALAYADRGRFDRVSTSVENWLL